MENKFFKMRRNGGALNRATENTEEHNISTNSARTMAQYGMSDSGMNFGAPLNSNHDDPDKKDGKTVYEEAMAKARAKKENLEKKKKEKKKSSFPKITMGMGNSYTTLND